MNPSKEEIRDQYQKLHQNLSNRFYIDQTIEKEQFDALHAQLGTDYENELRAFGYIIEPGPTLEERVKALEDKLK